VDRRLTSMSHVWAWEMGSSRRLDVLSILVVSMFEYLKVDTYFLVTKKKVSFRCICEFFAHWQHFSSFYHLATRRFCPTKFQVPPIGTGKSRSLYHAKSSASFFVQVGSGSCVDIERLKNERNAASVDAPQKTTNSKFVMSSQLT
jgi:hypothetical protein